MGKLHSFKRHLNAKYVQIAEAKAYDQAQAAKAIAQERKENDSKLIQEVLEVVRKNEENQKVDTNGTPISMQKFGLGQEPLDFDVVPEKNEYQ